MQMAPSGGQICNLCKWRHLVAKFETYASGATWWPNLEPMQVAIFLSAGEITQDKEAIPWVRCASGNVYFQNPMSGSKVSLITPFHSTTRQTRQDIFRVNWSSCLENTSIHTVIVHRWSNIA